MTPRATSPRRSRSASSESVALVTCVRLRKSSQQSGTMGTTDCLSSHVNCSLSVSSIPSSSQIALITGRGSGPKSSIATVTSPVTAARVVMNHTPVENSVNPVERVLNMGRKTVVLALALVSPGDEGFQPRIHGRNRRVRQRIRERGVSLFYLVEHTFDGVPISMVTHLISEAESAERVLEMVRVIDEIRHVRDVLFLAELTKRQKSELGRQRLKQPYVQKLVRVVIACCVQSVTLSVDANHRLVDRNLIRIDVALGL